MLACSVVGEPVLARPATNSASHAARAIAEGRRLYDDLDYEQVVVCADRALAAADATRADRIAALELKGAALVVLGRNAEAVTAFEQLFAIAPEHELPSSSSPRVLSVYRPAKARWKVAQQRKLALEHGAALRALKLNVKLPDRAQGGLPIAVVSTLVDPSRLAAEIVLHYRKHGQRHYATLAKPAQAGQNELAISGAFTASEVPYALELFVQARHRTGIIVAAVGDATHPRAIPVVAGQPPIARPVYKRWWFWTAAAVIAAAAIVTPIVIDQTRDVGLPTIVGRRVP